MKWQDTVRYVKQDRALCMGWRSVGEGEDEEEEEEESSASSLTTVRSH